MYEDRNKQEFINEVFIMVIMYHILLFTEFVDSEETQYSVGFSVVAFTSAVIMINAWTIVSTNFKYLVLLTRKTCFRLKRWRSKKS